MNNKIKLKNQNFISINSKCYPIHNDGGTCFTTYEISMSAIQYGFNTIVVIPNLIKDEKINITNLTIFKKNLLSYFLFLKESFANKENIIYYNCAYNFHIVLALLVLIFFKFFNKKINARIIFSAHGSFDNNIVNNLYKKLWIKFIIKPFIKISKAEYLANSVGEINNLIPQIKKLKDTKFSIAENKFPSFTFINEFNFSSIENKNSKTNNDKYILYLGRIVPKKRLIETIDFLSKNKWFDSGGFLVIAHTNDDNEYLQKVKTKIKQKSLFDRIKFEGKVVGPDKWKLILNANGFILLSESEGLPMTLLEADTLNVPIIYSKGCNYSPTSENSFFVKDFNEKYTKEIDLLSNEKMSAYDRASSIDYNKLHLKEGFYSSFKEIFDEKN